MSNRVEWPLGDPTPKTIASLADLERLEGLDWHRVLHTVLLSRALDDIEESELYPNREIFFQFSARGHDVTQAILAEFLTEPRDAVGGYYRSRPLALALGLPLEDALASALLRSGSVSGARDGGALLNLPRLNGPCILPPVGGVGCQYTPTVGWAQALAYRAKVMRDEVCARSIAVVHGGEASTSSNGFWAALNIATTQCLPLLFLYRTTAMAFRPNRLSKHRAEILPTILPRLAA